MDFLLSLSLKAKEKLAKASLPQNANKSVMYADQILSEEDVSVSSLSPQHTTRIFK
jgi:THO complex subunit 1